MPHDHHPRAHQHAPRQRVLLTGATGFIGRAAARALAARPDIELSALLHSPARPLPTRHLKALMGDLTRPDSLVGSCQSIDTLVHTASYVGAHPEQATAVNDHGTTTLIREATRAGVTRILYISTAAVYGPGPHHNLTPEQLLPAPRSPASQTRLAAENTVRAAGGTVLRPYLIYGTGDHWFIPTLLTLIPLLTHLPHTHHVKLSTIAVDELANALTALVTQTNPPPPGTILHANHPTPTTLHTLITTVINNTGLPCTHHHTQHTRKELPTTEDHKRHLARICTDHWYNSEHLWKLTNHHPGGDFAETFPRYAPWYRTTIAAQPVDDHCMSQTNAEIVTNNSCHHGLVST
jgi:nucleoside-diphosphate-sugar epimerase